jgi:hypothetical protein
VNIPYACGQNFASVNTMTTYAQKKVDLYGYFILFYKLIMNANGKILGMGQPDYWVC